MRRIFVFLGVLALVSLPTDAAVADPNCVGASAPVEAQMFHPLGQNLAKPLATSAPAAVGTFLSGAARAEDCPG